MILKLPHIKSSLECPPNSRPWNGLQTNIFVYTHDLGIHFTDRCLSVLSSYSLSYLWPEWYPYMYMKSFQPSYSHLTIIVIPRIIFVKLLSHWKVIHSSSPVIVILGRFTFRYCHLWNTPHASGPVSGPDLSYLDHSPWLRGHPLIILFSVTLLPEMSFLQSSSECTPHSHPCAASLTVIPGMHPSLSSQECISR
jgi:hypothetical protein